MKTFPTKAQIIKVFRQNHLSSVFLVKFKNQLFVKKTIHKDFSSEIFKQKYLAKKCKKIKIPKIHIIEKENKNISYLMEYFPHQKNKLKLDSIFKILSVFHQETENCHSKLFPKYDFHAFYADFLIAKNFIDSNLQNKTKDFLKKLFKDIFQSKYSVLHGDFHKDQVFQYQKHNCMIDFCGSFYGPKILDYTYFFRKKRLDTKVFNYINKRNNFDNKQLRTIFAKAIIIICIFDIAWLIKRKKHENLDFSHKIKLNNETIKKNFHKINT